MATYFLSGAAADDLGDGQSWSTAKRTMAGILALTLNPGDVIVCDKANQVAYANAQTYLIPCNLIFVSSTNPGSGTAITPTPMDTGVSIGPRSGNYSVVWNGTAASVLFFHGIGFSHGAGNTTGITFSLDTINVIFENCRFENLNTSAYITFGATASSGYTSRFFFINCSYKCTGTQDRLRIYAPCTFDGLVLDNTGTAPTQLIDASGSFAPSVWIGCDLNHCTGTLLGGNSAQICADHRFYGCKLGAGVTPLAAQSQGVGQEVYLFDCASGDTHGIFGYYNAKGSAVTDTGTRLTAGAAGQSWKIDTNSYATVLDPFETPLIPLYHTGTASITPYIECLRNDGTTSVFNDNEVWAEVMCKTAGGSPLVADYTDRISMANILAGSGAAAQASSSAAWTVLSPNNPQKFKIDSGTSITPAEVGYISFRVCVAGSISSLYIDPQPRTS